MESFGGYENKRKKEGEGTFLNISFGRLAKSKDS